MADVTYYVALPFVMTEDGAAPGETAECTSANSCTGDPNLGEFSDAVLLRAFGDVPSDLSRL